MIQVWYNNLIYSKDIHLYSITKLILNTYFTENVGEVLERNGYIKSYEGYDDIFRRQLNICMLLKKEVLQNYVVLYKNVKQQNEGEINQ